MKTVNAPLNVIEIGLKKPLIKSVIASVIQNLKIALLHYFASEGEPQIWQEEGKQGTMWHAYDPRCGYSFTFTSESEVRIWIEKRYSE